MITRLQRARIILLSLLNLSFFSVRLAGLAQSQPQTANGNAPNHVFVFLAHGGKGTLAKSVVEIARDKGMRIGLVTNATVYNASPAEFTSHIADQRQYRPIIDRYIAGRCCRTLRADMSPEGFF